jgi:C1A family cysteine protease/putative hemolysin
VKPRFARSLLVLALLAAAGIVLAGSGAPSPAPGTVSHGTIGDPAAVYCTTLGYDYGIVDGDGQRGLCTLPGGQACDAWEFLEGKCGQSYSYCAQQGYGIKTVGDGQDAFSPEYAVCVTNEGAVIGPVTVLSELAEKATGCGGEVSAEERPATPGGDAYVAPPGIEAPASFDWRSYQGSNWLTSIKDQGGCGSCWAFAAVGISEAAHNIAANNPDLDMNLAEQYLVSDCSSAGDCCGGWHKTALEYIRDNGVPDESCMPYVDGSGCSCDGGTCDSNCTYRSAGICSDRTCSNRCGDWSSRRQVIASTGSVAANRSTIKQALVDVGPLAVAMGIGTGYGGYWNGDIYRCTNDGAANHAVIIVGYDDAGGYWWVRNSWGAGWEDDGYFKLGYGECYVEQDVYYADIPPAAGDAYEPDGSWDKANWIGSASPQAHSIVPVGDVDWVKFSLSAESGVVIETSGASGDTRMWLYNSGLSQLEYDDDDGSGSFSRIDRLCGVDALLAGTYYAKIDEYAGNDEIPGYDTTFTVVQRCGQDLTRFYLPLVHKSSP